MEIFVDFKICISVLLIMFYLCVYLKEILQEKLALCLSDVKSRKSSQQEMLFIEDVLKFITKSLISIFYKVEFLRKLEGLGVQL